VGRLRLYLRYSTRSLRRGGQRTVLGVFCIAVGVMAVVALRLAGDMITASLTANVRQANGGDVSLISTSVPLSAADVSRIATLQRQGLVQQYIALGVERGTLRNSSGKIVALSSLYVLDHPELYPLVGDAGFATPSGATYQSTLGQSAGGVVFTQFVAKQADVSVGATVHLTLAGGGGIDVQVRGILSNQLLSNTGTSATFINAATYHADSAQPEQYGVVEMTTASDAQASQVADTLRSEFPLATVQTVQDAINQNIQSSQQVTEYLEIIGLLALAIGGIGIVNTLQVMLSRRRLEIAVLKTTGYRRRDLYALFGIEVGILGLLGGMAGTAAGVGMSIVVKLLIEQVIGSPLVFTLSPTALLAGVGVGVVTSLVFGLLPIVRAASVRPQAVLRDVSEARDAVTVGQTVALYAVVAALFIGLAAAILGDPVFALQLVIYALIGLAVLGGLFSLVVLVVGSIPVPERLRFPAIASILAAALVSALIAIKLQGIGIALLVACALALLVLLLPRGRRTPVKLALRHLRRNRLRSAGTLVALFAGVFTIGLILVLGQDISSELSNAFSNLATYDVFVIASSSDAARATTATQQLPGLEGRSVTTDLSVRPDSIDGTPVASLLGPAPTGEQRPGTGIGALDGVEGFDLAGGTSPGATVQGGRTLGSADSGTDNVLVPSSLARSTLHVAVGDRIQVTNSLSGRSLTLTVVGLYVPAARSGSGVSLTIFFEPILGDSAAVAQLGSAGTSTIISLKLDPTQKLAALQQLESSDPNASIIDLTDLGTLVQQVLGNLVDLLIGIASLALFAGAVIIANTVALAMLERRREIGILKSTGYTSRSVLAQVLVENGIVGAIGGISGMLLVTAATALLGAFALKTSLAVGTVIELAVIAGIVLLTMLVAALVAWRPSRVRPLEVLRYE
jgi:putative ABC transport system permease protein